MKQMDMTTIILDTTVNLSAPPTSCTFEATDVKYYSVVLIQSSKTSFNYLGLAIYTYTHIYIHTHIYICVCVYTYIYKIMICHEGLKQHLHKGMYTYIL